MDQGTPHTDETSEHLALFKEYVEQFLLQMSTTFEECPDVAQMYQEFQMLSTSEGHEGKGFVLVMAKAIHDHAMQTIQSEVPYRDFVLSQRSKGWPEGQAGPQLHIHDAYVAHDLRSMMSAEIEHPFLHRIHFDHKISDEKLDAESRSEIFKFMVAINEEAIMAMGSVPPGGVEWEDGALQEEKESFNDLEGAFRRSVLRLENHARKLDCFGEGESMSTKIEAGRWHEVMAGGGGYDMCSSKSWPHMVGFLRHHFPNWGVSWEQITPSEELWECLTQVNLLARLCYKTPPHLLEIIGDQSKLIAKQIASGEPLDIAGIGDNIMQQCNIEDLQLFTQLINSEIEAIVLLISKYSQSEGSESGESNESLRMALQMIGTMGSMGSMGSMGALCS